MTSRDPAHSCRSSHDRYSKAIGSLHLTHAGSTMTPVSASALSMPAESGRLSVCVRSPEDLAQRAVHANRDPAALGEAARTPSTYLGLSGSIYDMRFEDWSEEWQAWAELSPCERFRESERLFAHFLAMGGSLDPDPDPTSPFYDPEASSSGPAYGRPGLRVVRRSPV